jgi:glycosyltransferase involved in cell wall biosynthesis
VKKGNAKIVLISSGQPSLNPRLVKEADALADAGYAVTVIYSYWNDWGTRLDQELIPSKKWKATRVGGDPAEKKFTYLISKLIYKAARAVNKMSGGKSFAEPAIARPSYFLMREAKRHAADIYIGHNLGALPATVAAAEANKKLCGFDAEDFHRFEMSDDLGDPDVALKALIEDRYIPQLNYLTASSPLIAEAYRKLFPEKKPAVILNVFPVDPNVPEPMINRDGPLKLFWFSQTIGPNRGLENVISALRNLPGYPFELHLLGYRQTDFLSDEQNLDIRFHEPVASDQIPLLASVFDIGLAAENSVPYNRDICLTNKIFTYMQAGLAIVASDTLAQVKLMSEHRDAGTIYRQNDIDALTDILLDYHKNREKLLEARKASLNMARKTLNWETEKARLLGLVENMLESN